MIPRDYISVRPVDVPMYQPDRKKVAGLIDEEFGGVDIENASEGLSGYVWTCTVEGASVMLQRAGLPAVELFQRPGIADIALAFTQNMQPTVAWSELDGTLWMRWYDSSLPAYQIQQFGSGRCPRLALDDKRDISLQNSDVIFAYIAGGQLRYRQQRDAFGVERVLIAVVPDSDNLIRIGMGGLNLQFVMDSPVFSTPAPAPSPAPAVGKTEWVVCLSNGIVEELYPAFTGRVVEESGDGVNWSLYIRKLSVFRDSSGGLISYSVDDGSAPPAMTFIGGGENALIYNPDDVGVAGVWNIEPPRDYPGSLRIASESGVDLIVNFASFFTSDKSSFEYLPASTTG